MRRRTDNVGGRASGDRAGKLGNCGSQLSQWQAKQQRSKPKVKTPYAANVRGRSSNGYGSLTVPCPQHYLIPIIPSFMHPRQRRRRNRADYYIGNCGGSSGHLYRRVSTSREETQLVVGQPAAFCFWKDFAISLSKGVDEEVDSMSTHNGSGWTFESFPEWKHRTEPDWDAGPRWKTAPEWTGDSGH
ncbi:hypothetical protein [Brevibacillus laterosporus]|uniref:hypothetical protein n=1 Tax=Brevibacillus laterosporus TaxID=1465 RepID=UPI0018F8786E|nr:hypothetical protein [Brevibacillus laterosporus]